MKKRLISLALVLTMVVALCTVGAFAANDDSMEDLHVSKELIGPDSSGEYTLKLGSYASGVISHETVVQAVPTDFVLVLDQSGSMAYGDMPDGYSPKNGSWTCESAKGYYYLGPDGQYYQVYYKDRPTTDFHKLDNDGITNYTTYKGLFDVGGTKDELTFYTGNHDVKQEVYYKDSDGTYYRVHTYSQGLALRYHGTLYYIDAHNVRHDLGTWTYTWTVLGLGINTTVTVPLYTNSTVKRTGWSYQANVDQNHNYGLYYTDIRGQETRFGNNVSSLSSTAYSGTLYEKNKDITRVEALQKAANSFVNTVKQKAEQDKVNHKIAVVGFSSNSSTYMNTEILTRKSALDEQIMSNPGPSTDDTNGYYYFPYGYNYNGTQYNNLGSSDYTNALLDVSTEKTYIDNAIHAVTAYGGTEPEYGFNMAKNILDPQYRSETTYKDANNQDKPRNTVVVFFTDGHPGNNDYSDQIEAANTVVTAAKSVKDEGATVYSIGVFSEGDSTPLTYTTTDESTAYNSPCYVRTDQTYFYLRGNAVNSTSFNDTIGDYMRCVSSEYPQATKFFVKNSSGSATTGASQRGANHDTEKQYYFNVTDASGLENAFSKISQDIESGTTTVALDSDSVLKDIISNNVKLPEDGLDAISNGDYSHVEAYYVPCDGENAEGEFTFDETRKYPLESSDINVVGSTVSVKGFDYSSQDNIVAKNGTRYSGNKLIVEISGLKPVRELRLTAENTNDSGSGIYTDPEDAHPAKDFDTCYFPANAFAIVENLINYDGTVKPSDPQLYLVDGNNPFNVPKHVEDGYLYGGMYTDEAMKSFVTDVPGTALPVTAGSTYYVKSVSKEYLIARNVYLTFGKNDDGTGKVISSYGTMVVDDNQYKEVGFFYGPNSDDPQVGGAKIASEKPRNAAADDPDKDKSTLYSQVEFTNVGTYSPQNFFSQKPGAKAVDSAKMAVALLGVQANGFVQGYWITPDNVLVKGDNIRQLKGGLKEGQDATGKAKAAENTLNNIPEYTQAGIPVKAMFVGNYEEEEPVDTGIKLAGYTTSLNGNIAMNFYMDLSDEVAADKDAYMQFTLPGGNHTEEVVSLADAKKQVRGGKTYYVFSAGVAAKDMTSDIKAQFVKGDGTKSEVWTYTIKQYCDYIRSHPESYDKESVALVENMLNYGGYAQTYFKHNTDKMANADLDLALPEVSLDASFDPVISGKVEGLTYKGSSAMLTTTTGLRHYFELTGDASDYTFKANGAELELQSDKNNSYVLIDNIKAKDLKKPITLTVTDKNGNTMTLQYSVYTNIKQVVGNDQFDNNSQNLMKALYGYGQAALEYFATR